MSPCKALKTDLNFFDLVVCLSALSEKLICQNSSFHPVVGLGSLGWIELNYRCETVFSWDEVCYTLLPGAILTGVLDRFPQ
ncbi:ATM_1a_G0053800.mRNA.1.CDS.1 [Saccharomyces cerevisiae]|nr:ATM_1a_G0053800.mRNA.1.CDS.1 [Saccharomyces cerevisiae]CAI7372124.1 ATM_1a_G0053800.mRNA.1.CDS.1 [Saccharomyces cerevisiae]